MYIHTIIIPFCSSEPSVNMGTASPLDIISHLISLNLITNFLCVSNL